MSDYKTVFQLAQDKGYSVSPFHSYLNLALSEEKQELIVLTLIQKWLRDEHKIHVVDTTCARQTGKNSYFFNIVQEEKRGIFTNKATWRNEVSETYEAALLEGINEALKLI